MSGGILELIADVFLFLLQRIADLICFTLLVASLPAFWRWPWFATNDCKMDLEDSEWRFAALINFFAMLADLITLPFFFIALCSWRFVFLCGAFHHETRREALWKFFYRMRWHAICWLTCGEMVIDIFFFILFVLCLLPFWRFHKLIAKLYNHSPKPLCDCDGSWESRRSHHRRIVWDHLTETKMMQAVANGLANLFCALSGLVAILSVIRAKSYVEDCAEIRNKPASDYNLDLQARLRNAAQYRADRSTHPSNDDDDDADDEKDPYSDETVTEEFEQDLYHNRNVDWRQKSLTHGLFALRDLLCVPLALIVIASLYRAVLFFSKLIQLVSQWADYARPAITVTSQHFESPPLDRKGKGIVWRIKGTKEGSFTVPEGTPLLLYVRSDEDFWSDISSKLGGSVATFGQMLLPGNLNSYIDLSKHIKAGETDVELVFDFDLKQSCSTITETCDKFNISTVAHVQLELGSAHEQTLCAVGVPLKSVKTALDSTSGGISGNYADFVKVAKGREGGQRFCDVFWEVTVLQFLLFMRDILTVVGFLLMHAFPWRAWKMYSSVCQGPARAKASDTMEELSETISLLCNDRFVTELDAYVAQVDLWTRKTAGQSSMYPPSDLREFKFDAEEFFAQLGKRREKLEGMSSPSAAAGAKTVAELQAVFVAAGHELKTQLQRLHGDKMLKVQWYVPEMEQSKKKNNNSNNNITTLAAPAPAVVPIDNSSMAESTVSNNKDLPLEEQLHLRAEKTERSALQQLHDALDAAGAEYSDTACCDSKGNDGWDGIVATVAHQVADVLYDFASLLCFILTIGTVYRAPWTIRELWAAAPGRKRFACLIGAREVVYDVGYLLLFLLVLVSVRGTIRIITDMITYLPRYPSFRVARAIISYNAGVTLNILWFLLTIFFSCRAIKFAAATTAFAVMSPGVLLDSAILQADLSDEDEGSNKCRAGVLLVLGAFFMIGVPFISASQGDPNWTEGDSPNTPASIYLGFMAAVVGIALLATWITRDPRVMLLRRPVVRFARPTFNNAIGFVLTLFEGLQLLCLSFSALVLSGAVNDVQIINLSQYVFLLFGEGWTGGSDGSSMGFGTYFAVAMMATHFMVVAMPIVCGYILDWDGGRDILKHPTWIGAVVLLQFLTTTVVSRNVGELLSCDHGYASYVYTRMGSANATEVTVLRAAPLPVNGTGPICWEGEHAKYATLAMILAAFSIPASISRNAFFDESMYGGVDVVFTQAYRMLVGVATVIAVILTPLLSSPDAILIVVLCCSLWCLFWSVGYSPVVGACGTNRDRELYDREKRQRAEARRFLSTHQQAHSQKHKNDDDDDEGDSGNFDYCTLPALKAGRIAIYLSATVCAAMCLYVVQHHDKNSSSSSSTLWPVYTSIGILLGTFTTFVLGAMIHSACASFPEDDTLDALRASLLRVETLLFSGGKTHLAWKQGRSRWCSEVGSAMRVSQLALATIKLEESISQLKVSTSFIKTRTAWYNALQVVVDRVDLDDDMEAVIRDIDRSHSWCFFPEEDDCDFCENRSSSRRRYRFQWKEDAMLPSRRSVVRQVAIVDQALQTLSNATSGSEDGPGWAAGDAAFNVAGGAGAGGADDDDDWNNSNSGQQKPNQSDFVGPSAVALMVSDDDDDDMSRAIAASLKTAEQEQQPANPLQNEDSLNVVSFSDQGAAGDMVPVTSTSSDL